MSKTTVKTMVDLQNLPPLEPAQRAELEALRAMGDEAIDTGDIPPLSEAFWRNAVRNPLYKPTKTSTTVRIDSDVLVWLRAQGKGYQSRINAILRREMLEAVIRCSANRDSVAVAACGFPFDPSRRSGRAGGAGLG